MDAAAPPFSFDGRAVAERDLLLQLRDLFREHAEEHLAVEVLVPDTDAARRVAMFCSFSGLTPAIERAAEGWRVAAAGSPCRCGA